MARRYQPFREEKVITLPAAPLSERPANLENAAFALYEVVRKLIRNDGRMDSDDYTAAKAAVQLAERPAVIAGVKGCAP